MRATSGVHRRWAGCGGHHIARRNAPPSSEAADGLFGSCDPSHASARALGARSLSSKPAAAASPLPRLFASSTAVAASVVTVVASFASSSLLSSSLDTMQRRRSGFDRRAGGTGYCAASSELVPSLAAVLTARARGLDDSSTDPVPPERSQVFGPTTLSHLSTPLTRAPVRSDPRLASSPARDPYAGSGCSATGADVFSRAAPVVSAAGDTASSGLLSRMRRAAWRVNRLASSMHIAAACAPHLLLLGTEPPMSRELRSCPSRARRSGDREIATAGAVARATGPARRIHCVGIRCAVCDRCASLTGSRCYMAMRS